MKEKISAFIITKNEEEKINRCLEHIAWTDEIVIVDSESTDKTVAIAKKWTKKIYKQEFIGYAAQKQTAIEKCTNMWILEIDADEIVTEELKEEIKRLQENPEKMNRMSAYIITRQEYFLKKPLMTSKIPRLYKKNMVQYKGAIHEYLEINEKKGSLKGKILHESDRYDSIAKRINKINEYTKIEAEQRLKEKKWTTMKVVVFMLIIPIGYFLWLYIRKGLFFKGYRGLIWSILTAYYHFLIYAKVYEYIYKQKHPSPSYKIPSERSEDGIYIK